MRPTTATLTLRMPSRATLSSYLDAWPKNPWFARTDSTNPGDCTDVQTPTSYSITAHLSGGVQGDTVSAW